MKYANDGWLFAIRDVIVYGYSCASTFQNIVHGLHIKLGIFMKHILLSSGISYVVGCFLR